MQHLLDKIALVTGASKGIGRAIAIAFAKEGANVVVNYFKSEDDANDVVKEINAMGRTAVPVRADVSKIDEVKAMVKRTIDQFGRIDILVNNAGVSTMGLLVDLTEQEWDYNMDVNAKGVFLCCQAVARHMMDRRYGKIINISSAAGKTGARFLSHYCASKFAVIGLTQSLALELASYGINVNAVCPGYVETDMQSRELVWEAKLRGISSEEVKRDYLGSVPMGRLGKPEDVAKVVVFLASAQSDYMTGQAINVTGGIETH